MASEKKILDALDTLTTFLESGEIDPQARDACESTKHLCRILYQRKSRLNSDLSPIELFFKNNSDATDILKKHVEVSSLYRLSTTSRTLHASIEKPTERIFFLPDDVSKTRFKQNFPVATNPHNNTPLVTPVNKSKRIVGSFLLIPSMRLIPSSHMPYISPALSLAIRNTHGSTSGLHNISGSHRHALIFKKNDIFPGYFLKVNDDCLFNTSQQYHIDVCPLYNSNPSHPFSVKIYLPQRVLYALPAVAPDGRIFSPFSQISPVRSPMGSQSIAQWSVPCHNSHWAYPQNDHRNRGDTTGCMITPDPSNPAFNKARSLYLQFRHECFYTSRLCDLYNGVYPMLAFTDSLLVGELGITVLARDSFLWVTDFKQGGVNIPLPTLDGNYGRPLSFKMVYEPQTGNLLVVGGVKAGGRKLDSIISFPLRRLLQKYHDYKNLGRCLTNHLFESFYERLHHQMQNIDIPCYSFFWAFEYGPGYYPSYNFVWKLVGQLSSPVGFPKACVVSGLILFVVCGDTPISKKIQSSKIFVQTMSMKCSSDGSLAMSRSTTFGWPITSGLPSEVWDIGFRLKS